jgi:AcrR family transcriptional regulator
VEPGSATWWEAHNERLQRRRPRAGGLTVERVVDEALLLVDAEGLDALTVRRLAARLGTSSATLYRHVSSVDELLVLLIDRVLGEIEPADLDLPGRDKVVWVAFEFRRVLREHPGVVPALRAAPLLGPNATRSARHGLTSLLEAGLPPEVAVRGYLALIDFVLGSVFFDTAGHGGRLPDDPGPGAALDDAVSQVFRRVFDDAPDDAVFRFGLEMFLDGLGHRAGG